MENAVMLVWSKAALLGACGIAAAMREAPSRSGPPASTGASELTAEGIDAGSASPAYTETNCSCSQFTCGGLAVPACSSVCTAPKHAFCSQGSCSGPAGFESAIPNVCRCE
jgi:hypothetical protein